MFENIEELFEKLRGFSEYSKALVTLTTAVGVIVVLYLTFRIGYKSLIGFRLYVLNQLPCCQADFRKKYGQWVLITGSTDGIGLGMAKELARRGHSLIIVGRNEEKLDNTRTTLLSLPNVGEVVTVKIDMADSSIENYQRAIAQIDPENRDIGVLINNAGTFTSKYRRFNQVELEYMRDSVNVNILGTVYFMRLIMPSMIARGKGLVVNVSSMLGRLTAPYMGVYAPTKYFVTALSEQLQSEYASHPIDIVNLETGPVKTKLFNDAAQLRVTSRLISTPDEYAKSALNAIATPLSNMTGLASHGALFELCLSYQSMGLFACISKINAKNTGKDYKISPVPPRKKLTPNRNGTGDEDTSS